MTIATTAEELRVLWGARDDRYSTARYAVALDGMPRHLVEGIKAWRTAEIGQVPVLDRVGLYNEVQRWAPPAVKR